MCLQRVFVRVWLVVLALSVPFPATAADETTTAPDRWAHVYVFGVGLGLGVGGAVSWKYSQTYTGNFQTLNEGWFGDETYAGGADKCGHFFTDYLLVRGLHSIYADHGYAEASLPYALLGSVVIRTVMEVADGYTTFKFSPQDLIANLSGSLTSAFLISHPRLDDAFGMSWTYLPSREKLDGKVPPASIDNDYNGSTFHLDARLKGVARLMSLDGAGLLDHYTIGLSYYTRGYDKLRDKKQRIVGLTAGLNMDEIVGSQLAGDSILHKTRPVLRYFKLPFTFGGPTYDIDHRAWGFRYGLNYVY